MAPLENAFMFYYVCEQILVLQLKKKQFPLFLPFASCDCVVSQSNCFDQEIIYRCRFFSLQHSVAVIVSTARLLAYY